MFKSKKMSLLIFFSILLVGVFLRFYKLTEIPPGMTIDEVSIGYNGFAIVQTGKDQYGKLFPITHFRSVDDYKLPFYIYTVAISEKFFGNNIFSVRFPAALFGSLTIIVVFLLTKQLFGEKIGLISSLLFAVSPWHSFHSHLGLETNAGLFFYVSTVLFLYLSLKRQWFIIVGTIFFALSIYSHHVFWLTLPLVLLAFIIIHKKFFVKMNKKILFLSLLLVVLSVTPFVLERNSGNASRFNQSLMSEKRISQANSRASKGCNFSPTCTFIKSSADIAGQIANQYIGAYSLIILYGPSQFDQVNVVANRGLFYFFELPLFILGIIALHKKRDKNFPFLISWLLIYPLPLALTGNISAARMYGLLPLPQIIEAVGLYFIMRKNIILMLGYLFIMILSVFRFISDLWFVYPTIYSRYTGYGPIAIVDYINSHKGYTFYVEEPLFDKLYFLYFYKVLPNQITPKIKDEKGVLVIDNKNVYIVERGYLPPNKDKNILISFPQDLPKYYKEFGSVYLKDNSSYATLSSKKQY